MNRYFSLASADLVVPNQDAWSLLWDFTALRQLVDTLPGNTPYVLSYPFPFIQLNPLLYQSLQNKALVVSNAIMNVFDKGDATAVRKARKLAEEVFGEGWEAKGAGIYDEGDKEAQIWGIG
jgi:alpha-mannosidase